MNQKTAIVAMVSVAAIIISAMVAGTYAEAERLRNTPASCREYSPCTYPMRDISVELCKPLMEACIRDSAK